MYRKYTLDNGIRVITKKISHIRSATIGFWINTGSSSETIDNNGISHFIEHMLFKGTHTRTAKEIANTIDEIGGQINAFTGKECTCYYSKVLDSHLNIAIDILSDMILNSKFNNEDIKKEKSVILEEIYMYEDSPEDLVYDTISKTIFNDHPLGFSILGTHETILSLKKDEILKYKSENYNNNNIVISVAGSFDDNELQEELNKKIGHLNFGSQKNKIFKKPMFYSGFSYKNKDIEQVHICISFKGIPYDDKDIYSLLIMNNIFGGSISSRLFQSIREDNGLVYSIYSHPTLYKEMGLFTIYLSLNPSNLNLALNLIKYEINTLINNSISEDELKKSKEQLKGNYILGLESTSSIMTMLGKSLLFGRKIKTPDEVLSIINNININQINKIIKNVFNINNISMSAVGKIDENIVEKYYSLLKK